MPRADRPSTISGYASAIARALEARGADRHAVFAAAGLVFNPSNDPMRRLPADDINRLFAVAAQATDDPYFGLAVARVIQVWNLHALGFAIAASDTLLDACRRLERYYRMLSSAASPVLAIDGDEVSLRFLHIARVGPETEDAVLGFLVLLMRQLSDDGFSPLRVEFRHAALGPDPAPYAAHFRAPVLFDQPASALVFSRDSLLSPLAGASPELAQLHDDMATRYLARLDREDVVSRVRQAIVDLLPNGDCTRTAVARTLNMSPTTLRFKLARRGATFQDLLTETRQTLARGHLRQSTLSVTEIAFLLGFHDASNFVRAFRRWTGQSPTAYRKAALASA